MPPLGSVVLEVDAFGETGVFELLNDRTYDANGQRGFLLGGRGQLANEAINWARGEDNSRRGFYIDSGTGEIPIVVEATLTEGPYHDHDAGTQRHLQMGNTGDPSTTTKLDATSDDPRSQGWVMHRFCTMGRTDSQSPARLSIGEWHDGSYATDGEAGLFGEPLEVVIPEGPRITSTSEESSSVDVWMQCKVAAGIGEPTDATENDTR